MGVDFGDYDNDGYLDLIVPNFQNEASTLYRNIGKGFFSDESFGSGISLPTYPSVCWGAGFFDYDNDADVDLFIAAGHVLDNAELFFTDVTSKQRNFLFRNDGPGDGAAYRFRDVSAASGPGLAVVKSSRGTAFADYDRDGDLDVLVVNCNDTPTLLRNEGGNRRAWLQVQAVGTASSRDGIGARVEVSAGGVTQVREVKSGSSLYSQSELAAHFGLDTEVSASTLRVHWPGGTVDTYRDVPTGARVLVTQGGRLERLPPHPR
jgi:hypothetical protein